MLSSAEFQEQQNVSRESLEKCETYLALLERWQAKINLVGASTLEDPWRRHFLDSAQLWDYTLDDGRAVVDMGSGAGFPALVLAILGVPNVHVIESDRRKCLFMKEVIRECELDVTVHNDRVENLSIDHVGLVTARALAPLTELLEYAYPFIRETGGECLFLKGEKAEDEIKEARKSWVFDVSSFPSQSDPAAYILKLSNISKS